MVWGKFENHLIHPFTYTTDGDPVKHSLTPLEKTVSIVAGVLGTAFAIVGAPIAFYAISGLFKLLKPDELNVEDQKANNHAMKADIFHYVPETEIPKSSAPPPPVKERPKESAKPKAGTAPLAKAAQAHASDLINRFFNTHKMANDGNCCVYSLVNGMYPELRNLDPKTARSLEQEYARDLRQQVVNHLEENEEQYQYFCDKVKDRISPFEETWRNFQIESGNIDDREWNQYFQETIQNRKDTAEVNEMTADYETAFLERRNTSFVDYLTEKYSKYERDRDGQREVNFDEYKEIMRQEKTYFGPQELAIFAEIKKTPVIVVRPEIISVSGDKLQVLPEYCYGAQFSDKEPIYLLHSGGNHYDLLTVKEGMTVEVGVYKKP
jgi:hypothetical protein